MKPATQPPGLEISIRMACTPMVISRKTMLGLVRIEQKLLDEGDASSGLQPGIRRSAAPARSCVHDDAEAIQLAQQIIQVGSDEIDQPGLQRFAGGDGFGILDGVFSQPDRLVAAALCQRAHLAP